jgi:hypothetical protein
MNGDRCGRRSEMLIPNRETAFALRKSRPRMFGWFQARMPKEERFFKLFEKHAIAAMPASDVSRPCHEFASLYFNCGHLVGFIAML